MMTVTLPGSITSRSARLRNTGTLKHRAASHHCASAAMITPVTPLTKKYKSRMCARSPLGKNSHGASAHTTPGNSMRSSRRRRVAQAEAASIASGARLRRWRCMCHCMPCTSTAHTSVPLWPVSTRKVIQNTAAVTAADSGVSMVSTM